MITVLKFQVKVRLWNEQVPLYLFKGRKRKKPEFFCSQGSETKETALYFPHKCEMNCFTLKTFSALRAEGSNRKWDGNVRSQLR